MKSVSYPFKIYARNSKTKHEILEKLSSMVAVSTERNDLTIFVHPDTANPLPTTVLASVYNGATGFSSSYIPGLNGIVEKAAEDLARTAQQNAARSQAGQGFIGPRRKP